MSNIINCNMVRDTSEIAVFVWSTLEHSRRIYHGVEGNQVRLQTYHVCQTHSTPGDLTHAVR